jgi:hypothetical protein
MKHYAWVYDKIQQFVERRMPTKEEQQITNPIEAVNTVLTCEAC